MDVLTHVPHVFVRKFLPESVDFSSWTEIEPFFMKLEGRTLDTKAALEGWITDRG